MTSSLGLTQGKIIENRWKVEKFTREGSFRSGYYEVLDLERPIRTCTLKIESNLPVRPDEPPRFLILEKKLMKAVKEKNAKYNLSIEAYGEFERFNYVVFNLIGLSLEEIKATLPNERFTLRSCLHIARRSLLCLEELHVAGFIHRDIKPQNLFVGKPPDDLRQMYLGNYELCRQYMNEEGTLHRPRNTIAFRGSPKYASVNALNEHEQGRPDDLWAWFFTIVELTVNKLAWEDEKGPNDTENISTFIQIRYIPWLAEVKKNKLNDADRFLTGCPREYVAILNNLKTLQYETKPDYKLYLQTINEVMRRKDYSPSIPLDWEPIVPNVSRLLSRERTSSRREPCVNR